MPDPTDDDPLYTYPCAPEAPMDEEIFIAPPYFPEDYE